LQPNHDKEIQIKEETEKKEYHLLKKWVSDPERCVFVSSTELLGSGVEAAASQCLGFLLLLFPAALPHLIFTFSTT